MLKSVSSRILERIEARLHYLYGDSAHGLANRLFMMIGRYGVGLDGYRTAHDEPWDERDIVLITYGDMVHAEGEQPLQTLHRFVESRLGEAIRTIHILPFFPYSSDDGFSVKDYRVVDSALGSWQDIEAMCGTYRVMADLVINHVSRHSAWFKDYVNDIAPYRHFFHEMDPATDLSAVVRPRSLPLLTETPTRSGVKHVWTTFSDDQIDVNFAYPEVLFEYLDILLWYISKGVRIIRLDAIAFLWKVPGTNCIHLSQTHEVVKLIRDFLTMVAPDVWIITETNVPHEENISYFGDDDEAHMVYQFSLPPLLAHGLLSQDGSYLTRWAESLPALTAQQTFFNFTASHDGVGVRPLQGLIPDQAFQQLLAHVERVGGRVSYKRNSDGSDSPYELNITYFGLFAEEPDQISPNQVARFLSSQAIMLAMQGMPAIYFNSLFGACNDQLGVQASGQNRRINRQKWPWPVLSEMLDDEASSYHEIFHAYLHLVQVRRSHAAFHPRGAQRVLTLHQQLFAIERIAPDRSERILCVTNFSAESLSLDLQACGGVWSKRRTLEELISDQLLSIRPATVSLAPYQTVWLRVPTS